MRAPNLKRCGSFFQIQPIIHDSFRIACAPPPRHRKRSWIEEARRDIQAADTISSLRPLVTAENEKINTAVNNVNGKNAHSLRGINDRNQVAFTTQSAQCNEIVSKTGCELDIAGHENACLRCDASLNIVHIDDTAISRTHKMNPISLLKPGQRATGEFISRAQHISAMIENARDEVHPMRGAICKRDAARIPINETRELLAYLFDLAKPTVPCNVTMFCHFVVVALSFASGKN